MLNTPLENDPRNCNDNEHIKMNVHNVLKLKYLTVTNSSANAAQWFSYSIFYLKLLNVDQPFDKVSLHNMWVLQYK